MADWKHKINQRNWPPHINPKKPFVDRQLRILMCIYNEDLKKLTLMTYNGNGHNAWPFHIAHSSITMSISKLSSGHHLTGVEIFFHLMWTYFNIYQIVTAILRLLFFYYLLWSIQKFRLRILHILQEWYLNIRW